MGNDMATRPIRWIYINRGALGEFDGEVCFQLVELLKNRLPDVGDAHLASDIYLHECLSDPIPRWGEIFGI
jgi:hypothetical protein